MTRRASVLVVLLLITFAARADGIGGAYRGPYGVADEETSPQPGGGSRVIEDVEAFWPFWFEFNKEWILAEKMGDRLARGPEWVTKDQREKIIFPLLVESNHDRSVWVRDAAVLALGKYGGRAVVPFIVGRLSDKHSDVREHALIALGRTGESAAARPLRGTLAGMDRGLKAFAALGLGLLGEKDEETIGLLRKEYEGLQYMHAEHEMVAGCIAVALGALVDESNEDLIDALADPLRRQKPFALLKVHVCQALGRIGGERCRDWLRRAARDKSKEVRAAAILGLSAYPERRVVRELMGVKCGHRMSRLYSRIALGTIGAKVPRDDLMRQQIATELAKYATRPAMDKYQAQYAAMSLALMGDGSASEYFAEQLTKENRTKYKSVVHSGIAMALGLLGDDRAVPDLREIALQRDLDPDYRGYAAFALGLLGDTASKERLKRAFAEEGKPAMLRSGCWALGLMGDRSDIPWLIERLKSDEKGHFQVRGAAALAIGMIGDAAGVEPLVKIAREDEDSTNRAFAIAALGCLVDPEPLPRIPRLFKNLHYRRQAPIVREVMGLL